MFLLHITYKELKTIHAVTYGINIAKKSRTVPLWFDICSSPNDKEEIMIEIVLFLNTWNKARLKINSSTMGPKMPITRNNDINPQVEDVISLIPSWLAEDLLVKICDNTDDAKLTIYIIRIPIEILLATVYVFLLVIS